MRKARNWLLLIAAVAIAPILTLVEPDLVVVAAPMIVIGLLLAGLAFVVVTFRRSKFGPAAFWIQPSKFLTMTFTASEVLLFSSCIGLVISGIFVLIASALSGN